MGLLKDMKDDAEGYVVQAKVTHFLNPLEWKQKAKWRKQRADRGWSDRDTWGAGEHIAEMTAQMLQRLNDKSYVDWPLWFDLNVKEKGKGAYKNLQSVIDDINNYLEHEKTSWADDLESRSVVEGYDGEFLNPKWFHIDSGKQASDAEVRNRINKWHKENTRLYKKSTKAMQFFGRHYASFWD